MRLGRGEKAVLRGAAETICDILGPKGQSVTRDTDKAVYSAIAGLFRPYIRQAMNPLYDVRDKRVKEWRIKLAFWDVTTGSEDAILLTETDPVTVGGLRGVAEAIRDFVDGLYGEAPVPDDFDLQRLEVRMSQLRPSLWRQHGRATSRISCILPDGHKGLCQVDLSRAGVI